METILDFEAGIKFKTANPPLIHAYAIESHRHGLLHLAKQVRALEQQLIDAEPYGSEGGEMIPDFSHFYPVEYCAFNWFSISLISYLRLIALVDQMQRRGWRLHDLLHNSTSVNQSCASYAKAVAPAVLQWRNKVAAHPTATQPIGTSGTRPTDTLGTVLQSFSCPVDRSAGYLEVARTRWKIDGQEADVLPWSVTATYERLTPRFWPESSLTPHRHRVGEEPTDEAGTYLWQVRQAR